MVLLAATQFLLIIDTSIINVIVPTIAGELKFSTSGQSWIANAYLIAFGGALLFAGRFADLVGRTRIFQAGLIVLVVGSVAAAIAFSPLALVIGRAIQGLGAALSAAASLALILATFRGEERQRALGLLAAMAGLGGAAGTFLGGALTEWFGWRSTFWVNVVAGMLLVLASYPVLSPLRSAPERKPIDYPGAFLLILGQSLLAFGIVTLAEPAHSSAIALGTLISAIAVLILFRTYQRRSSNALIPSSTWQNSGLVMAAALSAIGQFVLFPMFFLGNLYLQNVLGYTPFASGIAFLPLCAVVVVTASQIGLFIGQLGLLSAMALGFACVTIGLGWLTFVPVDGSFTANVLGPTLIIGVGLPIIAITANILGGQFAKDGEEGLTSGLLNTAQQFGSVLGLSALLSVATLYTSYVTPRGDRIVPQALVSGYSTAFLIACLLAAATTAFLLLRARLNARVQVTQPDLEP